MSRRTDDRDTALDALKGLAIIGMILVNHAAPTEHVYAPFRHALWDGWTLADTIFPAFLLAVGVSIVYSLGSVRGRPWREQRHAHVRIVVRSLLLAAIGTALLNFPYYRLDRLFLAGVLLQIAVCYLVCALLFLHTSPRTQAVVAVLLLLGNWMVLSGIDWPVIGRGPGTPEANPSLVLNQLLLGRHARMFDAGAVGALSVLVQATSIASTLAGVLVGHWLRRAPDPLTRAVMLGAAGFALIVLGAAWDAFLPIIKPVWSASFAVFMAGISMCVLGALYAIVATARGARLTVPLQVAGVNALFFYVFAQCLQRVLVYGRLPATDGGTVRLRHLIYQHWFAPIQPPKFGALLYTLTFLLVCYAVVAVLYRQRIVIKL